MKDMDAIKLKSEEIDDLKYKIDIKDNKQFINEKDNHTVGLYFILCVSYFRAEYREEGATEKHDGEDVEDACQGD